MKNEEAEPLLLCPAYDRRYLTIEECMKDWNDGKDFKIYYGPYCSIRDVDKLKADGYTVLLFVWGVANTNEVHEVEL